MMPGTRRIPFLEGIVFSTVLFLATPWGTTCDAAPPERADPVKPCCAFVAEEWSEVAELTETNLRERPSGIWLERNKIDRVLAEHELAASFAPDSARQRIAIGQLLKADVLVLLRTERISEDSPANRIDLVVAETNGGLRILAHCLPQSPDAEADADRVVGLVDRAMAKYGETIREIYAVPPFLSRDLGNENDHLMSACAALVEHVLLAQPGVLVVETAEAEAIAREYALAAPSKHVVRPLPIYLLGEYRHDGHGDPQRLTIRLETKRGDRLLETTSHTMLPKEARGYLERAAIGLLGRHDRAAVDFDPAIESRELARRSGEFLQLRDWQQALTLAELSVLLDPEQPEARTAAILALSKLRGGLGQLTGRNISNHLQLRRRSFQHLKRALESDKNGVISVATIATVLNNYRLSQDMGLQLTPESRKQQEVERDFALKKAYDWADQADWDRSRTFFLAAIRRMTSSSSAEEKLAFLSKYQHTMGPVSMRSIISFDSNSNFGSRDDAERFWRTILSWRDLNTTLKNRVLATRRRNEESNARFEEMAREDLAWKSAPPVPSRPSDALTFRPLELVVEGENRDLPPQLACVPLDDGSDVFWSRSGSVYHVATLDRGEETIWKSVQGGTHCLAREVVSDGRYLWIINYNVEMRRIQLDVIDSQNGQVWHIRQRHGLPIRDVPINAREHPVLKVAPLEYGEAIVAGYQDDAWLARVQLDPDGNHRAEVFHEAKEIHTHDPNVPLGDDHENSCWNSHITYCPTLIAVLTDPKSGQRHIAIPRSTPDVFCNAFVEHALIVDTDDLSVSVMKRSWPHLGLDRQPGLPSQIFFQYSQGQLNLMRLGHPERPPAELFRAVTPGFLVEDGTVVHVVGRKWQRGNLQDRTWESLGETPWEYTGIWANLDTGRKKREFKLLQAHRSNVYGFIVVLGREYYGKPLFMVQVLLDGSGVSFEEVSAEW